MNLSPSNVCFVKYVALQAKGSIERKAIIQPGKTGDASQTICACSERQCAESVTRLNALANRIVCGYGLVEVLLVRARDACDQLKVVAAQQQYHAILSDINATKQV